MDEPSALTAAGLILDIAGAVILALGLVLKTPQATLDEATPKWDFNAALDASLAAQSADAQVGASALVLGFALQIGTALGWQQRSWTATGVAVVAAVACVSAAWLFLVLWLRPNRIRELLVARLSSSDTSIWWPVLAAYGQILDVPFHGDPETIGQYAERVLGSRRWAKAVGDRKLPDVMTKPRSELAGTKEYEEAHASPDEGAEEESRKRPQS